MALSHYYEGFNQLIALPKEEQFETYDLNALTLKSEQDILDAIPPNLNSPMIWLITDTGALKNKPDYRSSYEILENFITRNYSVQTNQDFYGTNVKLLNQIN